MVAMQRARYPLGVSAPATKRARALKNSSAWGVRCMVSLFLIRGDLCGLDHARPLADLRLDVGVGCIEVLGYGLEALCLELLLHVRRVEDLRDRQVDSFERRTRHTARREHRVPHVD